jgi:acetyltransferase-like isoleucine patch superfamily enzyme
VPVRAPLRSHGTGVFDRAALRRCPDSVVLEPGALVFHPENVSLGEGVYVGHYAILKGYYQNELVIGDRAWIGQAAFLHAAGGLAIGDDVGIGPHVCVLTSRHADPGRALPIMEGALELAPVRIGRGSDIGIGAIILPGVTIGEGVQIGAGSVVTRDVPDHAVAAGNPARVLRGRR